MVDPDDDIRSAVQTLGAEAPEAPSWESVQATNLRQRRRRKLTIGAGLVVLLLIGVAVIGRAADDRQTVVAGPIGSGADGLPCEGWIAVHTLFDSTANSVAGADQGALPRVTVEQAAFLVESADVPDRVASELGGNASELVAHVVANSNANLGTVEIVAWADGPNRAMQLADAFAEALLTSVQDIQQREVSRQRDVLNAAITQLELDLAGVTGSDRSADAIRDRLTSEISAKRPMLSALDERAAQGSNLYSFGSSEAFFVTGDQLAVLFSPRAISPQDRPATRSQGPGAAARTTVPASGRC